MFPCSIRWIFFCTKSHMFHVELTCLPHPIISRCNKSEDKNEWSLFLRQPLIEHAFYFNHRITASVSSKFQTPKKKKKNQVLSKQQKITSVREGWKSTKHLADGIYEGPTIRLCCRCFHGLTHVDWSVWFTPQVIAICTEIPCRYSHQTMILIVLVNLTLYYLWFLPSLYLSL